MQQGATDFYYSRWGHAPPHELLQAAWALGGAATPQPLQGAGGATAVPRRLNVRWCRASQAKCGHIIGMPEGPTLRLAHQ